MDNIKQLRERGFIIEALPAGGMKISSKQSFYYYDPYVSKEPEEIYRDLMEATKQEDNSYAVISGEDYPGDDSFLPISIVGDRHVNQACTLFHHYQQAERSLALARQKFIEAIEQMKANG